MAGGVHVLAAGLVAIRQQVGLPVKYIGVGEKPEDLALFQPAEFVDALFAEVGSTPLLASSNSFSAV